MDKGSFFFTANCGICHPGGAATQYDRTGRMYFDRTTSLFGYGGGVTSLPASPAGVAPSGAQLDGDYGFVNPSTGVPGTANWSKTGVLEADCLMCHLNQFATGPGTPNQNAGLSWYKRTGTLRAVGVAGIPNNEWAPTAGAGWAAVTYQAGQSPPMAATVTIDYGLGLTAGTLVNQGGFLAIPLGKVAGAADANCRGCHSIPDGRKSGRTLLASTDVHTSSGVTCVRCHVTPDDGVRDRFGLSDANPHQIGKGDITIGSVRNDLDGTVLSCADCHLDGADPLAPDPSASHRAIPSLHFGFMKCQVCHVRYLDDDPASPLQEIPDLVIEMTSNGTQNVSMWNAYLGTDPVNPGQNLPELAGRPFRWYPAARWWKGRLTTVKPLYTAWFGEWLGGTGDLAQIRPIPLRLVRKTLANAYAPNSARLASLSLTPGTKVSTGATILHRKAEIREFLLALRAATDTANPDAAGNDVVARPVLVRADRVYFLNASDEVEWFHSAVGESHDFAVNHNVVARRDPANPVVSPGPYGAGGCNDCHGPSSPFFYGKQLAEPAQYDFLDELGTVPNPHAGEPEYVNRYEIMGYTESRAEQLTATKVPVLVQVLGAFGTVTYSEAGGATFSCTQRDGGCKVGVTPGATVTFTATPDAGAGFIGFSGCTVTGPATCTVTVGVPATGVDNRGVLVGAQFSDPPPPPPPTQNALVVRITGGQGTVAGGGIDCRGNAGTCGMSVTPVGSTVSLTASAWTGYSFVGWRDCGGATCDIVATASSYDVTVSGNKVIVAEFVPNEYPVSVRIEGNGTGSVTGSGLNCWSNSGTCLVNAAPGTAITMTATPAAGSSFQGWSGCPTPSGAACTVTVSGAAVVRASFSTP